MPNTGPGGIPLLPVLLLRLEALIRCPSCGHGIGFLHTDQVQPHCGVQVVCPACGQRLGIALQAADLGRPHKLIV